MDSSEEMHNSLRQEMEDEEEKSDLESRSTREFLDSPSLDPVTKVLFKPRGSKVRNYNKLPIILG